MIRSLKFTMLFFVVFCTTLLVHLNTINPTTFAASWYDSDWQYRKKITINSTLVDDDLTDFPIYVNLNSLGSSFFSRVKSDGSDVVVTSSDGTTKLSREIVDIDTGAESGEIWFKATSLSSTSDSIFYIYYGNAAGAETNSTDVWSADYLLAAHLNTDPSGTSPQMTDSSPGGNNGTTAGSMSTGDLIDAKLGKGLDFDGANDYINFGAFDSIEGLSTVSLSAWINQSSYTATSYYYKNDNSGIMLQPWSDTRIYFSLNTTTNRLVSDVSAFPLNEWFHLAGVYTGTEFRLYINGVLVETQSKTTTVPIDAQSLLFGFNGNTYPGTADELQITSNIKTDEWISTEYNNQNSPSTFYSVSSTERPLFIDYQVKLTNLVDETVARTSTTPCIVVGADTCDFRISLYDQVAGGTLLFQETHENLEIGDYNSVAQFYINSVCLGWEAQTSPPTNCTGSPTVSGVDWVNNPTVYVELEFDDDGNGDFVSAETFERKLIASIPFAYFAQSAGSIAGFGIENFVILQPGSAQSVNAVNENPLIFINENGASTPNLIQLARGGTTQFIVDNDGHVSIGTGSDAYLDIKPATTEAAQINFSTSSGIDPASPVSGDIWFNGSNFYGHNGSSNIDFLNTSGVFIDSGSLTYLADVTEDFVIGGSTIDNSAFGVDVNLGDFYFGSNGLADLSLIFKNSSSVTTNLNFNINNAFEFTNGATNTKVGINTDNPTEALDVVGDVQVSGDILTNTSTSGIGSALKPFNNLYANNLLITGTTTVGSDVTLTGNLLAALHEIESYGSYSIVQSTNDIGDSLSMAINQLGNPVFTYSDDTNHSLSITVCADTNCNKNTTTQYVVSTLDLNHFGTETLIDNDNLVRGIFNRASSGASTRLVLSCSNIDCSTAGSYIAGTEGRGPSGIILPEGTPMFFDTTYDETTIRGIYCTVANCSSRSTLTLETSTNLIYPSAVVASNSNPFVIYGDGTNNNIRAYVCDDVFCSGGTARVLVDPDDISGTTDIASWTNMVLGTEGFPIIIYHDIDQSTFGVINCEDLSCSNFSQRTLDLGSSVPASTAKPGLEIKLNGAPLITYQDSTNSTLNLYDCFDALCENGEVKVLIDDGFDVGINTDISRVNRKSTEYVIAFQDETNGDIGLYKYQYTTSSQSQIGDKDNYFSALYTASIYTKNASISNFDVAEEYFVDDLTIEAGDVVRFKKESDNIFKIERTNSSYDDEVIGVISTEPGLYLKGWEENKVNSRPVALVGRVPVKVTNENGVIKKGDLLTSSAKSGFAMKATSKGYVIGRALEDFDSHNRKGHDSNLVRQYLEEERREARNLLFEYQTKFDSNDQSNETIEEIERNIKTYSKRIDDITAELATVDASQDTGRIMMYVDLSYVGDNTYEKTDSIVSGFSPTDSEFLNEIYTFFHFDSDVLTVSSQDLFLRGNVSLEGNLEVFGNLSATSGTFETVLVNNRLTLPEKLSGTFTLPKGTDEIFIESTLVSDDSFISLTSLDPSITIAIIEKRNQEGFVIKTSKKATKDITVQFVIIN